MSDPITGHITGYARAGVKKTLAAIFILCGLYAISQPLGNLAPGAGLLNPAHAGEAHAGEVHAASLSTGEMAAFVIRKTAKDIAPVAFKDRDGADKSLDDFKGKVVLLNLWASWCAPCRHEMPSLDRLNMALGGEAFEVVTVSIDRKGVPKAQGFFDEVGVTSLALYVDRTSRIGGALGAFGLPVSILIGPDGRELGRLAGPAEWDSADAIALIEAAIAGKLTPGS